MNINEVITDRFLVYGTLRPGCGNYDHYFPYVNHTAEDVRIPGFAMYGVQGFPYAVRAEATDSIECSLITVTDTPENVAKLQRGLDFLEGYNPDNPAGNHYDRIYVSVNGHQAHLYVAGDALRDQHVLKLPRLESGNWYEVSPPRGGVYVNEPYTYGDGEEDVPMEFESVADFMRYWRQQEARS